jgi:uncharacterized membrane protein YdjX (TVP38/TMEM64 family)
MATVDGLRETERRLEPFEAEVPTWRDRLIPDNTLLDPERPIVPEPLLEEFTSNNRLASGTPGLRGVIFLLILVGIVAAWQWTPLRDWLDVEALAGRAASLRDQPTAPVVVIGGYVLGGFVLMPVTVLIAATALAFGPLLGFVYSLLGCLASATLAYGIGYFLGHDRFRSIAGARIDRLSRRIAHHGVMAVLIVRLVPVAPFTVVNMMAGASHIRLRDFVLGTCLGMLPGLLVMTLFGDQLDDVIRDPQAKTFLILIGLMALLVLLTAWVRRRFRNTASLAATELPTDGSQHG